MTLRESLVRISGAAVQTQPRNPAPLHGLRKGLQERHHLGPCLAPDLDTAAYCSARQIVVSPTSYSRASSVIVSPAA
jgi:hypothetical protein